MKFDQRLSGPMGMEEQEWHIEWDDKRNCIIIRYWFDIVKASGETYLGEKFFTLDEFKEEDQSRYEKAIKKLKELLN